MSPEDILTAVMYTNIHMQTTEEAKIFGAYIVGAIPSQDIITRYIHIATSSPPPLTTQDKAIISFIYRHPGLLGAIDAYAAFFRPESEIRRRLFIMFAVLEATPEYADKFLPKDRGFLSFLTIFGVSLRAFFRLVMGCVVMAFIGAKR